jgi:hypothetical protein
MQRRALETTAARASRTGRPPHGHDTEQHAHTCETTGQNRDHGRVQVVRRHWGSDRKSESSTNERTPAIRRWEPPELDQGSDRDPDPENAAAGAAPPLPPLNC